MTDDEKAAWAKITITQTVDDLLQFGPSIEIGIAPAPYDGMGKIMVCAQIDTGAAGTAMSPRLSNRLRLNPIDTGIMHEAGRDPVVAPYFRVTLFLPSTEIETDIVGLPALNPPHDVLIGRDILTNCRVDVDFTSGLTVLHVRSS